MTELARPSPVAILVLGMHRSGTSASTRVLNLLGVDLNAQLLPPVVDNNAKGFWESTEAYLIHDELLASLDRTWHDMRELPVGWLTHPATELARQKLRALIGRDFQTSQLWAVKDPRVCRLAPLWIQLLNEMDVGVRALLVTRDPREVVESLRKRDGWDAGHSYLLWAQHVLEAEMATRDCPRALMTYDDLMSDWRACITSIGEQLGIEWPRGIDEVAAEIEAFLDTGERHQDVSAAGSSVTSPPSLVVRMDATCRHIAQTHNGWEDLAPLNAEYRNASDLFGAPVADLARREHSASVELAETSRRLAEIELARDADLKQLHEVAKNRVNLESMLEEVRAQCARMEADHLRVAAWATELNEVVLTRDAVIEQLNEIVKNRTEKIIELQEKNDGIEAIVKRYIQDGAEKDRLSREREEAISSLVMEAQEKDARIGSLGETNAALHSKVNEQASLVTEIRGRLIESEHEHQRIVRWTGDLQEGIIDRDSQIAALNARSAVRLSNAIRKVRVRISSAFRILYAAPRAVAHHRSVYKAVSHAVRIVSRDGVAGLSQKADILKGRYGTRVLIEPGSNAASGGIFGTRSNVGGEFLPKVSVIVPNYNHGPYLRDRLESIYKQTYKNIEVILLDDCSTDNSLEILNEYVVRYSEITICSFNSVNSGGVFNQWKKGLRLASGDLIWIAESDDYCTGNFLEELVAGFANPGVMLSFCRTDFVLGLSTQRTWSIEEYLAQFGKEIWARPFVKSAHALVNEAWAVKNIVPNVSSAVFRNPGRIDLLEDLEWMSLRLCGDWIFYLTIVRGGLVAYNPLATNFYRQHPANTSVNAQREEIYYREHEIVCKRLVSMYKLDQDTLVKHRNQLYQHWLGLKGADAGGRFNELFDLGRIQEAGRFRKPNIVIAVYSLAAGGGETLPLVLANLLKSKGYAVVVLNCAQTPTEIGVKTMLDRSIPLLELGRLELVEAAMRDMGVELVHSHHAWVDVTLSALLASSNEVRQVVTMHGMYEMLDKAALEGHLNILDRRVDRFVYTAEKNLGAFNEDFRRRKGFVRIDNALARSVVHPVSRAELGISEADFVLCMVARAIPDKGWEEAIDAVVRANDVSSRKIHLLLIGQGAESERLNIDGVPSCIHFLGFKKNIRDYFAMADIGFIPSRFHGESFPLVLIDCLYAGKPLLASAIGEIREMLRTESGMAGEVFELRNWAIDVGALSTQIANLANDRERYACILAHVHSAADKFDPEAMYERYEAVYKSCVEF